MSTFIQLDTGIIRRHRRDRGWSQSELVRRLQETLDRKTAHPTARSLLRMVQRWEKLGRVSEPWAIKLAYQFGVDAADLQRAAERQRPTSCWLLTRSIDAGSESGSLHRNLASLVHAVNKELDRWKLNAAEGDELFLSVTAKFAEVKSEQDPWGREMYIKRIKMSASPEEEILEISPRDQIELITCLQPVLFSNARAVTTNGERLPPTPGHYHYSIEFDPPVREIHEVSRRVWPEADAHQRLRSWLAEKARAQYEICEAGGLEPLSIYRHEGGPEVNIELAPDREGVVIARRCLNSRGNIVPAPWPDTARRALTDWVVDLLPKDRSDTGDNVCPEGTLRAEAAPVAKSPSC